MFRKMSSCLVLVALLGLVVACGDDGTVANNNNINNNNNNTNTNNNNTNTNNNNTNTNNNNTNTNNNNNTNTNNNNTNTNNNNNSTMKDGGMSDGSVATPTKAKSNSGALCGGSSKTQCKSSDEVCLSFSKTASHGMCLGKCVPNKSNPKDPANFCPVKDTANQMALCSAGYKNPTTGAVHYACLFYCSVTRSGTTKTYKCPNSTDYDCKALNSNTPNVKMCVPK